MNRPLFGILAAALAAMPLLAADAPAPASHPLDAKIERLVRQSVTQCAQMTLTQEDSPIQLPQPFTAMLIKVASPRPICETQLIGVTSRTGGFYIGIPWVLTDAEGNSLEEKLKNFTWKNLQTNYTPEIDRHPNADGLFPVKLVQTIEGGGKLPMEGEIDPYGKIFFLGHFHRMTDDVRAARLKAFEPHMATAPQEGAAKPDVTIIEFSDFECPSCQHAAGYLAPILSKYGDHVRYVRYDLPLTSAHPWALAAAIAGRAIYRQKPAAFWDYKKTIYDNQEHITAFTIDDFARNFAKDHDLDMTKYDADVASAAVKDEILKAAGAAFTYDVRSTPTYVVNGVMVDPGSDGKALETYVAGLLKK
jgi:protein-disulfide isomerase